LSKTTPIHLQKRKVQAMSNLLNFANVIPH